MIHKKPLNLNHEIYAKLTRKGKAILKTFYVQGCKGIDLDPEKVMNMHHNTTEKDLLKFQLWDFMRIFGSHMSQLQYPVIEDNLIFVKTPDMNFKMDYLAEWVPLKEEE
jgi:hypothetical protein